MLNRASGLAMSLAIAAIAACAPTRPAPLRVGLSVWIGYEPLHLSRLSGDLDPSRVRLIDFPAMSDAVRELRDGRLDAAGFTLDDFHNPLLAGYDLRVVLVCDESAGGDALVARPGITSVADLRGRTIGMDSGVMPRVLLTQALARDSMKVGDVHTTVIDLPDAARLATQGALDAVIAYEPLLTRLRALGWQTLYDSSREPGLIVDLIAVRPEALRSNPGAVRELVNAWFAGLDRLGHDRAVSVGRIAWRLGVSPAEVQRQLAGVRLADLETNRRLLGANGPAALTGSAEKMAAILRGGALTPQVPVTIAIDPAWLPRGAR